MTSRECKPFLRWAGGKNWFIKHLSLLLNELDYESYHEPFLGGGSVFFSICPDKASLSDLNSDLVNTYKQVRDNYSTIKKKLEAWPVNADKYYEIRAMEFSDEIDQAAQFIYLNRTSYNGIYRVNRAGQYNVPYGHNDDYLFSFERIEAASKALQGVDIKAVPFTDTLSDIQQNDFVFLDPPYTVSHNKNGFIEYNKTLFSLDDQRTLKSFIDSLNEKGAFYVLTNAAHESILEIFEDESNSCFTVNRQCLLGGKKAKRGLTEEYVFTNIPSEGLGVVHE